MKRVYLGTSRSKQPMAIESAREYSPAVYERLSLCLAPIERKKYLYRIVKRLFDLVFSVILLLLLSPLMLGIAFVLLWQGEGVWFCQERIGKDGNVFICYKFRTMVKNAPPFCPSGELYDRERYLTPIGKWLRRYSLDELPQLFSVLKGDMSLVGYRPLIANERDCHAIRESLGVYRMRPGITGYAQLMGRDDVKNKNKALLDAYYVKNASLWWDIALLWKTVFSALSGKGNLDADR